MCPVQCKQGDNLCLVQCVEGGTICPTGTICMESGTICQRLLKTTLICIFEMDTFETEILPIKSKNVAVFCCISTRPSMQYIPSGRHFLDEANIVESILPFASRLYLIFRLRRSTSVSLRIVLRFPPTPPAPSLTQ